MEGTDTGGMHTQTGRGSQETERTLEKGRARKGEGWTRPAHRGSIYPRIQLRSVTLFHESTDRIALIAWRVKLPRPPLIDESARVLVGTGKRESKGEGRAGLLSAVVHGASVFAAERVRWFQLDSRHFQRRDGRRRIKRQYRASMRFVAGEVAVIALHLWHDLVERNRTIDTTLARNIRLGTPSKMDLTIAISRLPTRETPTSCAGLPQLSD